MAAWTLWAARAQVKQICPIGRVWSILSKLCALLSRPIALPVAPAVESRYAERRQPREERTMATSRHAPPKFETVLYEKTGPICFINEMQRQSRLCTQGRGLHLTEDFRESAAASVERSKPTVKGR